MAISEDFRQFKSVAREFCCCSYYRVHYAFSYVCKATWSQLEIFSDNFPSGIMGAIVSHPLLREEAVKVFPPLFPSGSGALELTNNKCLKPTPICPPHILWVCAVSPRHGATHISKRCCKAHIFHKACWEIIIVELLPLRVAAISVKQLDLLASWFPFSGQTDRVLEGRGNLWGSQTKQQQLSCRPNVFQ